MHTLTFTFSAPNFRLYLSSALNFLTNYRFERSVYEGVSINNQSIPFPIDRDGHDFYALYQYMFYTWVQNFTRIESFFNKILNVKHG